MDELKRQPVGYPEEFFRTVDPKYADAARNDFAVYLQRTLFFNQRSGGRYNPPGEFGVLYTASDEETAWAELHARFLREGASGLPSTMGLLRILVTQGLYVDFADEESREAWDVSLAVLQSEEPTADEREACWELARRLRPVADFFRAPSARADGANIPLFIAGREAGELEIELAGASDRATVPVYFRQQPTESWDD
ncbi:RES family NAD+ phosphorylase [Gemmatimonas sp.]|uniref:RES family NAD+ phosphorylase n=1 Tax=Gemmatimonas sp. TaxID=1962908 RepID=UPI003341CDE0